MQRSINRHLEQQKRECLKIAQDTARYASSLVSAPTPSPTLIDNSNVPDNKSEESIELAKIRELAPVAIDLTSPARLQENYRNDQAIVFLRDLGNSAAEQAAELLRKCELIHTASRMQMQSGE